MKGFGWLFLMLASITCSSIATAQEATAAVAKPEITEHYVMLYYDDLDEPAAFYGDLLGLKAVMDDEWVKLYEVLPNSFIGIVKGGEEGSVWHKPQAENAVMVSIVSKDVDAWYDVIKNSGDVKVLKDIYDNPSVPIRAFLVADPGGYTIEFFQWLDR
jgi:predicted enzyme related to lactoylglutathione lyase